MHLRNAEIFCDVVAHRSFSRAGEARQMSQPAISQAVQQLEEQLGTTLIDRSTRPLELTPIGSFFHEECRRLLDGFRELEDRVVGLRGKVIGRLRVAAIYSVGLLQMSGTINRYRQQYPDVDLHLDYLHPDDVYDKVQHDEADLGLVSFPRESGEIATIQWVSQPMVVVTSPDHSFADCPAVHVSQLRGERFVAFTRELRIRRLVESFLKKSGVDVQIVHQFDNVETVKRAVEIGAGISILPEPTLQREADFGLLRSIPIEEAELNRPLGIIHKRNKHLSLAAERFIELLEPRPGQFSPTEQLAISAM